MWRRHAGAHEQDNVLMPGLPVVHHLLLKELEVILVVAVHLQQADGHLPVPAAFMHLPPATLGGHNIRRVKFSFHYFVVFTPRFSLYHCLHLADELPQLQLLVGYVPLLQVHTSLADLSRDRAPPTVHTCTTAYCRRQVLQPILVTLLHSLLSVALVSCFLILSWVLFLCLLLLLIEKGAE